MGNEHDGRLSAAILGLSQAISRENAQTRTELHAAIATVRTDAYEAHQRIRDDLTQFIAASTVQDTLFRAEIDHLKRVTSTWPPSDDNSEQQPSLTRRDAIMLGAGATAIIGLVIAIYKALPAIGVLLKAAQP
jgi:hypothetical protein